MLKVSILRVLLALIFFTTLLLPNLSLGQNKLNVNIGWHHLHHDNPHVFYHANEPIKNNLGIYADMEYSINNSHSVGSALFTSMFVTNVVGENGNNALEIRNYWSLFYSFFFGKEKDVDTPKNRTVSLINKFTEYDTKKIHI